MDVDLDTATSSASTLLFTAGSTSRRSQATGKPLGKTYGQPMKMHSAAGKIDQTSVT